MSFICNNYYARHKKLVSRVKLLDYKAGILYLALTLHHSLWQRVKTLKISAWNFVGLTCSLGAQGMRGSWLDCSQCQPSQWTFPCLG